MDHVEGYLSVIIAKLQAILKEESERIDEAAAAIATSLRDADSLLHVFGTGGHSMMAAEEIFHRAGGLVQVDPIFFASLSVTNNVLKSRIEQVPGVASVAMRSHIFKKGEIMLIVSHVGTNSMTIDAALEAKRLGLFIVGIGSREICATLPAKHPARHPSGKALYELTDIFIDNKIPYGDAVVEIPGAMQRVAPVSSILVFFILHSLEIRIVEKMLGAGQAPAIWRSGNMEGGDEHNNAYHERYKGIVKAL